MAFVSWWTVGLLLRQTRWKPFKSHFLWLWEDQRTEEVLRIEIMLFVILWHKDKTIKLKINVPAPTGYLDWYFPPELFWYGIQLSCRWENKNKNSDINDNNIYCHLFLGVVPRILALIKSLKAPKQVCEVVLFWL